MHSRGRVFGVSVCLLFVCLFNNFWAVCTFRDFQGLIVHQAVVRVKKVACGWSTIDRNGLEARKTLVLTRG